MCFDLANLMWSCCNCKTKHHHKEKGTAGLGSAHTSPACCRGVALPKAVLAPTKKNGRDNANRRTISQMQRIVAIDGHTHQSRSIHQTERFGVFHRKTHVGNVRIKLFKHCVDMFGLLWLVSHKPLYVNPSESQAKPSGGPVFTKVPPHATLRPIIA